MAFTPAPGNIFGVSGIGLAAILLLFGAKGDPPVDIGGGSIYAKTSIWHKWHKVDDNGRSYSVARTPDNTQIVITDSKFNILLACTAPQWVVSLYENKDSKDPVAQFCTNHQCEAKAPVDGDGNLYLNSSRSGKGWRYDGGVMWWNLEYEDDDIHINKVELTTAGPPTGRYACPATCPNASSQGVPDYHWHVRIGKSEEQEERKER
jgi:hypothetical protein